MNKEITIWKKFNSMTKEWEHNHIEDGHCSNDVPTPVSKEQKQMWKGHKWLSVFGFIDNGKITFITS